MQDDGPATAREVPEQHSGDVVAAAIASMDREVDPVALEESHTVWVRMSDAVFTQALDQPGFPQVPPPMHHTVVARIVDDALLPSTRRPGVDVVPSLAADGVEVDPLALADHAVTGDHRRPLCRQPTSSSTQL